MKRDEEITFSFGIRLILPKFEGRVTSDWATDLDWANPSAR